MIDLDLIPEELLKPIMERNCIFFVGAGMAIDAKLPSGYHLTNVLFKEIRKKDKDYKKPQNFTLPRLATDFQYKYNRNKLEQIIRKEIAIAMEKHIPTAYTLFSKIPLPKIVITTNYDRLLEKEFGLISYVPIFKNMAVNKFDESKMNLYKIHGDIDNLDDAIITEDDSLSFEEKKDLIWNDLKSYLQKKPIVFIGYSLEDEYIRSFYKKLNNDLKGNKPIAYAITPDESSKQRFKQLNIKHIKMTASDFLEKLLLALDLEGFNTFYMDIPDKPNYNPFSIYSTEYFPENDKDELINTTFIQPIHFAQIIEPGITIIQGHRGSGKTMILKYLSYEVQKSRSFQEKWDRNFIGIYLKFKNSIVSTTTIEFFKGTKEEWYNYFSTYCNLLLFESILRTIRIAYKQKDIDIKKEDEFVSDILFLFFNEEKNISKIKTIKKLLLLIQRIRNKLVTEHSLSFNLPPDFLEQFIDLLKDYITEWSSKSIYFLLDEYDCLDVDQQKVINTIIKDRSFSFKIGVKLFCMNYEDISGRKLEYNNDYTYVSTDRFDAKSSFYKKFESFLIDIANKRLEIYGYKNKIEDLLPEEEISNKKGFEYRDYSGLKNIIKISSGIIRDFLELVKDMIYYSNPWVVDENKETLNIITPNLQNTIIKIHSNILYQNIDEIVDKDEDSKLPRSNNLRVIIDSFARIFHNILEGSKSVEVRTVSSFQIKNPDKLSTTAINALNDGKSYRLLQVPYSPRAPQDFKRYTPHTRYKFHRLLCPRFKLSLSDRWPKEISSELLNDIFHNQKEVIDQITKYFLQDIEPTITKSITDYLGDLE